MNRSILILILFSWSIVLLANDETVIVLQEFGARGKKGARETVIAGKDFLMVNAQKLTPGEIITQSQHIKTISEFKSMHSDSTCEAGRFEHILKKGKLIKKEVGCLESDRYSELKASFKALAKDPFIENK